MKTKTIYIIVDGAESGQELQEAKIEQGSTARDMLLHFNLNGYVLVPEGTVTHLSGDAVLWTYVDDGGKLRATPVAEVGMKHTPAQSLQPSAGGN